jgi:N-acetylmuramoyl-L-alanine amidase
MRLYRCPIFPVALLWLASPAAAQALLLREGNLAPVHVAGSPRDVVKALLALPGPRETAQGLTTAIPRGVELLDCRLEDGTLVLTFSEELLGIVHGGSCETALEQIGKTATGMPGITRAVLLVRARGGETHPLEAFLDQRPAAAGPSAPPPLSPTGVAGALIGRTIFVSPGHGYYWHTTLGWTTQRGAIDGLTEDIHTNEIALWHLIPFLEDLGARVVSCRERGLVRHERFGDNDQGAPAYVETGAWTTSTLGGWNNLTYRWATAASATSATATWTLALPADGTYPVQVIFRAGSNRAPDARFVVQHSGGGTTVLVDQTQNDLRWVHLGSFFFRQSTPARVTLDNQSAQPGRVVVADAVRIGAGLGSIARGGGPSGRPRWQEAARYWAQYQGAPSSVWDSISGGQDNDDDVTARPRFSEWHGGGHAFLSLHTNAGGGAGTETFIYSGGATPGSAQLQAAVQRQVITDLRAEYDASWVDRGNKQANFGEVRLLSTMPGILVELAFHDTPSSLDHRALHDPRFRRIAGRALARGVLRYFSTTAPFPPEPPLALRVRNDGARGLRVEWEPSPGASFYSVEVAPDGKGFVEAGQTSATSWSTGALPPGTVLGFRVRAHNPSGRSSPTEVLCAGTSHLLLPDALLVNGFDRFDRYVKDGENTRDYLARHADAIRRLPFSLGFDAASNEAVHLGRVQLPGYRAIVWALGEESTQHETFSTGEQALVQGYLAGGGRLLVTGSEIGWDLDANGSPADRVFCHQVLGVRYVADDANTYAFQPGTGALLGAPGGSFDSGTGPTYDVNSPDVLAPADAQSAVCLAYSPGGQVAGVQRSAGTGRILTLGFPLEAVLDDAARSALLAHALRFLLAPRALDADFTVAVGNTLPLAVQVVADAGRPYVLASALAPGAIPLPGGGILPLAPDAVFGLSLLPNNGVFIGFAGILDAQGNATASFVVPNLPILRGVDFWFSGMTIASTTQLVERTVLPWVRVRIL